MRVTRHQGKFCDCGQQKDRFDHQACKRCMYLDGRTASDFELIQLLREASDGYTAKALAGELGRERESVHVSLQRLRQTGRVMRLLDAEGRDDESRGRPAYLYRLVDKGCL
jgi:predicted transcriptional regulator